MAENAPERIEVGLDDRAYPIHVGLGLLQRADLYSAYLRGNQLLAVTDENVAELYLENFLESLEGSGLALDSMILPAGEAAKNLQTLECIVDRLLERRYNRDCTLVALGGGVVGDVTGFTAACYQRGVALLQVPTTLLAQVDSSVGGKTAVNHSRGKNMIGAFHQPTAVIADVAVLDTLPDSELRSGLAETIKYGLIRDAGFFAWLERNVMRLRAREPGALIEAVVRSCRNKAEVVAEDERESGMRAILNLGHTFAHAIETALGYRKWKHGEAVSAGMAMAADLSLRHGWLDERVAQRVHALLEAAGLPTTLPPGLAPDRLRHLMATDKKARSGKLRLVLLEDIGKVRVTADFDEALLRRTLEAYCRPA